MKFNPTKMGAEKVLVMLKGGGGAQKSFEVVLTWELEVLAILMGGTYSFHLLKGGHEKFYPVSRGRTKFWTRDFPIL